MLSYNIRAQFQLLKPSGTRQAVSLNQIFVNNLPLCVININTRN